MGKGPSQETGITPVKQQGPAKPDLGKRRKRASNS